ncbi:hypothetical protein ATANTOWER_028612 [Ataeniobius toweri]|uniref:Secreted protein n=1 Tax=Ataeniobius toweri TaxID=208326 RepID=A0ABU7ARZ5_9TELE|nr:hypothetical protein [Ataeniobius toweri]
MRSVVLPWETATIGIVLGTLCNLCRLNFVHMIRDRMTLLDPIEELCLSASKEALARCVSLSRPQGDPRRRDRLVGEGCSYTDSGIMGTPLLQFAWLCWK